MALNFEFCERAKMGRKKLLKSQRSGLALGVVLLAVAILLVTGSGLLSLGMHGRMLAVRATSEIAARTAADAGLTKAVFEMNEKLDSSWDDNTMPQAINETLPGCDATFSYTVTGDASSGYTVECIGNSGQAQKEVSATLRLKGLFENAIYAEDSILIENDSLVDASGADIVTNPDGAGTTITNESTILDGDITEEHLDLPEISVPDEVDYEYANLDIPKDDPLTIDGDVILYVPGDITMKNYCELQVSPGSSLILYLGGAFTIENISKVNTLTQEPKRCQIYGVGAEQTFTLGNETVFYGVIYAPNAVIDVGNATIVHGAIVADNVVISNESELYYDTSLSDVGFSDMGVKFVVKRWRE